MHLKVGIGSVLEQDGNAIDESAESGAVNRRSSAVIGVIGREAVLDQQPGDGSVPAESGPVKRRPAGRVGDVDSRLDLEQRLDRDEMTLSREGILPQ